MKGSRKGKMKIIIIICLLISLEHNSVFVVNADCTWPPDFVNSTWTDSLKGDMDFTSTTMTGWTVSLIHQQINNWECVTYNTNGPFLVMKSTSAFERYGDQFTCYRCLMLEKITDFSYRYYQMEHTYLHTSVSWSESVQSSASYDRLYISRVQESSLNDIDILCTQQTATGPEFQIMLRKGYEVAAVVTCPYSLLANYEFTYQHSNGRVSCDSISGVGYVEMCSNVTQLRVMNHTCSTYPFYTSENTVWCVDVVVVGTDTFVSLYNGLQEASSIDETNTFKFTCVGLNVEGTSMSVTPQHCKGNQSSTKVPTDNQGRKVGAVLNLSRDGDTCPPCPLLSNPARGNVIKSTNGAVTKATYSCEGNYTLIGNDTRICQGDGTWSGSEPSCICPKITSFPHGSVTLTTNGLSLTFICDAGYVLVGEAALTCNTDTNTWSNTTPTCACNTPSPPGNGTVTISEDLSKAVYTCRLGFTIQGPSTRTCQPDGSGWSFIDPVCAECPELSRTGGSFVLFTNGTTTTAKLTCARGYVLVGCDTVECQSNGSWKSSQAECVSAIELIGDSGSGNTLLLAVIVLAILAIGFAAAIAGSVFYIWKLKKPQPGEISKPDQSGSPSHPFTASLPTVGTMQDLVEVSNTSTAMSASISQNPTLRSDYETLPLRTSRSNGSGHLSNLDLVRSDTASTINIDLDELLPWNRYLTSERANSLQTSETFYENTPTTTTL